ncbi:MAG: precorrin-3B C(17)-methyltransferase [Methanospirillaceae archaeon]|nr:precorrin-3B C(17)-methyltransferase [Methanospirillaceae archaeon]
MATSPSQSPDKPLGRLSVVGLGPGSEEMLTYKAVKAIQNATVIIGNSFYLDQISSLTEGKEIIKSSMGQEVNRARESVRRAETEHVVMISGGDPGIYGMAGIVLEVLLHAGSHIPFEVIPGVTAASAGASLLGSPLSGDFCVISLSDLLTPWEVIEKRLHAAFSMQVPVVLYNPKSRKRVEQFSLAMRIAGIYLAPETPVGIVQNASRLDEKVFVSTIAGVTEMTDMVDMHSVVFVGGNESTSWRMNGREGIITRRGYHTRYVY